MFGFGVVEEEAYCFVDAAGLCRVCDRSFSLCEERKDGLKELLGLIGLFCIF